MHSANGTTHQYTVGNIAPGEGAGYTLTLDFGYGDSKTLTVEVPKKDEYVVLDHSVAAEPLAVVVTFSEPLKQSQNLKDLIRFDTKFRTSVDKNRLYIYPESHVTGNFDIEISRNVLSKGGQRLKESYTFTANLPSRVPAIRFAGKGSVLPSSNDMSLLFESVNYRKARVRVRKIFANNLLQFFQQNYYGGDYYSDMDYVSRIVRDTTVDLSAKASTKLDLSNTYSLDLSRLITDGRKSMYLLEIKGVEPLVPTDEYDYDYYFGDYRTYRERSKLVLQSDIGIICKSSGEEEYVVYTTDLLSARPKGGCKVRAYDKQNQTLAEASTDSEGRAVLKCREEPSIVAAEADGQLAFVKVERGAALSLSNFDVGGTTNPKGTKGFLFGERGVWRPGDEIHLTLIVEDKQRALPKNHPVTLELYTPSEQLYDCQTLTESVDGIYVFHTRTGEDALTGQWDARFKVGGQTFHHPVRIETIKPNRLKIAIASPEVLRATSCATIDLEAHWLTGPVAAGLQAKVEMSLYGTPQPFDRYANYVFSNPLRNFSYAKHEVFSGRLDSLGRISCKHYLPIPESALGMLQANLIARVTEAGGNESLTSKPVRYSPYDTYVGIALGEREFETDCDLRFPVVTVDADGNPLSGRNLEYKIYRLDWSWWWEGSAFDLNRYVQGTSAEVIASSTLNTVQGKAEVPFRLDYPAWGKYLVFVRDTQGGHATGGVVYIDWPDWRVHSGKSDPTAATMLSFSLDKRRYEAGETATIYLPRSSAGRVLLSVENGSRVLSRRWVQASADRETACKMPVTWEMSPNFYVHATLLQPHAQTANDLPIRMYGIEGAEVIDRRTILHPEIEVADEIRPQQEFSIRIRERDGKPMSYTLAIVDEGLLDITAFKTPQPWQAMNQREVLGVRTWDMYDEVIRTFAGRFTPILSIGGDEALRRAAGKEKRFNPVVQFLGPFTLRNGVKTHKITLPMYVGSVRVMAVAARERCYGHADKTVAVRSPLVLLPTLPRTLACGDRVKMPVNVFATAEEIRDVTVSVAVEGPLLVAGTKQRTLAFATPGEQLTDFELICDKTKRGRAKVTITARGGGQSVAETVHIEVRNPLPDIITSESRTLRSGERYAFEWTEFTEGEARLELAALPTIDFGGAFAFVENYAHLCTEQLSSRAIYMLHARRFLGEDERKRAEKALPGLLKAIELRQLANGGFAYWPGYAEAHDWATSMIGAVMTEARRQGFTVSAQSYDRWKKYQHDAARRYRHTTDRAADLLQAYRLYTLALAGEQPTAAMNKLRESKQLSHQALLRLAAVYAVAGRDEVAAKLLERADGVLSVNGSYATFWSPLRDLALEVETWVLAGHSDRALTLARRMASDFSATGCTTQEVAFVSTAMGCLADMAGGESCRAIVCESDKTPLDIRDIRDVKCLSLDPSKGVVTVENCSDGPLTVSLLTKRRPGADETIPASASSVTLSIRYTDLQGRAVTAERLRQGEEFMAKIEVKKNATASESMALTFAVPSGWEIWNDRLVSGVEQAEAAHTDIRDDRISWYFPLAAGQSKRFTARLQAAYCGRFAVPPAVCEDMYAPQCRAITANGRTEVAQ